ncbi:DUF456 family protein [Longimicrobium sp.]|uniref:DUF456 family protein n=1 Tax=Longimicrobium sp. TaxID=2029185 RepID=UPI003B3A8C54
MAYALLALSQVAGLLLVPFGLPGTWVQVLGVVGYAFATDFQTVGWATLTMVLVLAALGEVVEFTLGGRYARKYGGSRRAAWGAILGGIAGAIIGVPVFLIGSVIGAFVGAFAGAALMEYTRSPEIRAALRVGWGAFVGRMVAIAAKSAIGVAIAAVALLSALG